MDTSSITNLPWCRCCCWCNLWTNKWIQFLNGTQ